MNNFNTKANSNFNMNTTPTVTKKVLMNAQGIHKMYSQGGGQLHILKGVDLNIYENEALCIVGASGAGKSTLMHILGALDNPDDGRVLFKNKDLFQLNDDELAAYYQAADLFTMISREIPEKGDIEGFGIVYLEANSFKLPVVAGRTGGVEDAVVHGKTGLLVDPYSCEQIASSITHLLQNQELAHQLGNYGWQRVETEFMGQSVSHHILQTLTSLQRS